MSNRKTVTELHDGSVYLIDSEPDDGTRYQYLVYRDGPDEFTIAPTGSTFLFPQRMNLSQAKSFSPEGTPATIERLNPELNQSAVNAVANRYKCNPCTVVEVARTVIEIWDGKHRKPLFEESFLAVCPWCGYSFDASAELELVKCPMCDQEHQV